MANIIIPLSEYPENNCIMDELIISLLKENGRIILPDFGALIVKQKNPFTVIFNEFLQYNDGFFTAAVENKFQISKAEAVEKVQQFVSALNQSLDKGEEILLEEIGILYKTPAGKITLSDRSVLKQGPPADKTNISEIKTPDVEFDLSAGEQEKDVVHETSASKTEFQTRPITDIKPRVEEKTKIVAEQEFSKEKAKPEPVKPLINDDYSITKERSKASIIIWVLLIILVNGAIIGYFIFNNEIKIFLNKKSDSKTNLIVDSPEVPAISNDTAAISDLEPTITVEEPQTVTEEYQANPAGLAGTKYYVVAGVFRDEANAERQVSELREKGFNAEKFGKIGHMFAVSYDVFQSKSEADKFLKKIQNETDPGAWIKIID